MKIKDKIISKIERSIEFPGGNPTGDFLESIKEDFVYAVEWKLESALKNELKLDFLKRLLHVVKNTEDDDVKKVIINFRDKDVMRYLLSAGFEKSSSCRVTNLIALYKGSVYSELYDVLQGYVDFCENPEEY